MPKNSIIVQVGDLGMGFTSNIIDEQKLKRINSKLKSKKQKLYAYRGNHDAPKFFNGDYIFSNLELLPDYSTKIINDKVCLFVGGAISIDRCVRIEGRSYWKDEAVKLDATKIQKCDILFTHTCGTQQYPQILSNLVYGWAEQEKKFDLNSRLLEELKEEKTKIDKIIELSKPKYLFYGHFHHSFCEMVDGIQCRLLNINEVYNFIDIL